MPYVEREKDKKTGWSRLHVALYRPEIPPNTGNIARTCAATRTELHIVGTPGFRTTDRHLKRAGLDYWHSVKISYHSDFEELQKLLPDSRFIYFTSKAHIVYTDFEYRENDCLVFGCETTGLPQHIIDQNFDRCVKIPIYKEIVRCLNLATSVGIALYEALRQLGGLK